MVNYFEDNWWSVYLIFREKLKREREIVRILLVQNQQSFIYKHNYLVMFSFCFHCMYLDQNMVKSESRANLVYNLDSWGTWSFKSKILDLQPQSQGVLSEFRVVLGCYNVLDDC